MSCSTSLPPCSSQLSALVRLIEEAAQPHPGAVDVATATPRPTRRSSRWCRPWRVWSRPSWCRSCSSASDGITAEGGPSRWWWPVTSCLTWHKPLQLNAMPEIRDYITRHGPLDSKVPTVANWPPGGGDRPHPGGRRVVAGRGDGCCRCSSPRHRRVAVMGMESGIEDDCRKPVVLSVTTAGATATASGSRCRPRDPGTAGAADHPSRARRRARAK